MLLLWMTIWSCCATREELGKSNSPTNSVGVATHLKHRPHHPFAVTDTALDDLLHEVTIWILYFVCMNAHCRALISPLHTSVRQTRPHLCSMPAFARPFPTAPHPRQALTNVDSLAVIDYILPDWVLPNTQPRAGVWFLAWAPWLKQSSEMWCFLVLYHSTVVFFFFFCKTLRQNVNEYQCQVLEPNVSLNHTFSWLVKTVDWLFKASCRGNCFGMYFSIAVSSLCPAAQSIRDFTGPSVGLCERVCGVYVSASVHM